MLRLNFLLLSFLTYFANYEVIDKVAQKFEREFTLFNVGAGDGDYAFEMSEKFPDCKVIMVEDNNPKAQSLADALLERCLDKPDDNTPMLLNKRISKTNFKEIASCMHFDIVTYLGDKCYNMKPASSKDLDYMLNLGWHTFFEVDPENVIAALLATKKPFKTYQLANDKLLFHFVRPKNNLAKHSILAPEKNRPIKVNYSENFEYIYDPKHPLTNKKIHRRAGINLADFKILYGVFPTNKMLDKDRQEINLNNKRLLYPYEIIATNKGIELETRYIPDTSAPILNYKFFKDLCNTNTRYKINELYKTHSKQKSPKK